MILIFGGAYQGKLAYALDRFNLSDQDVYFCHDEEAAMPGNRKIIYEIDQWILALIKTEADILTHLRQFMAGNTGAIVICNDISCGIVPVDPTRRQWREAVGLSLAELSREADEVIRLFCAVPTQLK